MPARRATLRVNNIGSAGACCCIGRLIPSFKTMLRLRNITPDKNLSLVHIQCHRRSLPAFAQRCMCPADIIVLGIRQSRPGSWDGFKVVRPCVRHGWVAYGFGLGEHESNVRIRVPHL